MESKYQLGVLDYMIVILSLVISAVIGIVFRFTGGRQSTTNEYLMAGRNMSKFPVVMSLTVSCISTVAMLGFPAEVYKFGVQYIIFMFSQAIGSILATYIVIPVYFQCGVSTIYEFLEMRFGKTTKYAASVLFIIQMVTYMSTAIYGPALVMNVVTDIPIETSILVCAGVCTFYCTIGGLKAVMWTDAFQAFLMFITIVISHIAAINEVGGFSEVYNRAASGARLDFNFSVDMTIRYTFWSLLFLGIIYGIGGYSTNQTEVQRLLSLSSCKRAQSAMLWSIAFIASLFSLCILLGVVLYAVFYLCDPILNTADSGLNNYDQLLPYFIVTRFSSIPCLTGFLVSGIFSGSLSTISSIINALSAVTVTDIIKPIFSKVNFSETKLVLIAKSLSVFYGCLGIGLAFRVSKVRSIMEVAGVLLGTTQGPVYAVFLLGMLTTRMTEKNILFGLIIGTLVSFWIGLGSLYHGGDFTPILPLNSSLCSPTNNMSVILYDSTTSCLNFQNCSDTVTEVQDDSSKKPFILYRLSFTWITVIGWSLTLFFATISRIFIGRKETDRINLKCLSPITKLWMPRVTFEEYNRKDFDENTMEMESVIENDSGVRNGEGRRRHAPDSGVSSKGWLFSNIEEKNVLSLKI